MPVRWWFLAALIGYSGFFLLYPSGDSPSLWQLSTPREEFIARTRDLARDSGVDASQWLATITVSRQKYHERMLALHPETAHARFLAPLRIKVQLEQSDGNGGLQAQFGPAGRLFYYDWDGQRDDGDVPSPEVASPLAEAAFDSLAGADADLFDLLDEPSEKSDYLSFTWKAQETPDEAATPRVTARVRDHAYRAELEPTFSDSFRELVNDEEQALEVVIVIAIILAVFLFMAGFGLYVVRVLRRQIRHLPMVWFLSAIWLGLLIREFLDAGSIGSMFGLSVLVLLGMAPLAMIFWGSWLSLAEPDQVEKGVALELAFGRGFASRPICRSAAIGLLAGGPVLFLWYLIAALAPRGSVVLGQVPLSGLLSETPWSTALNFVREPLLLVVAGLFLFWRPLISRFVRRTYLFRALFLVSGAIVLSCVLFETSLLMALLGGLGTVAILEFVYLRADLLSVFAVVPAVVIARVGAALRVQPSEFVSTHGLAVLFGLAALIGGLLILSRFGRVVDIEQIFLFRRTEAIRFQQKRRGERERLLAEFQVAQRAQQQMLPSAAAAIPGCEVSAICQPAREVGGDLYDFVELRDGRWAIVVADVSGKGVPAALFMTLTKGLLESVARTYQDPRQIVSEVNRHLNDWGRRSVFVTLAVAIVDSEAGTVDCIRAGHNPLVLRQAENDEIQVLNPSGIGLGLTGSELFQRSLQPKRIRMDRGDTLFLYSDGITEAMDSEGAEYGQDRLLDAIAQTATLDAEQTRDRILEDVKHFVGDEPPNDDITLVVLRQLRQPAAAGSAKEDSDQAARQAS